MIKKHKLFILFFITILILLPISCKKNNINLNKENILKAEEIKKSEKVGVVNVDRLRFRSDNDIHSKTLRYLDKGTIVLIIMKDNMRVKIGEMEGYWYQIEFEGITGWAFGFFLDVYSSYDSAKIGARKYIESSDKENNNIDLFLEYIVNKNFFFLSNGKINQVIDVREKKTNILKTISDLEVIDYFFSNNSTNLYYIAKRSNHFDDNGNLYYYSFENKTNNLITKNVFAADINEKKDIILILSKQKSFNKHYWIIKLINLEEQTKINDITKIQQNKSSEISENDTFSMTLSRELGSFSYLKLDEEGNFIYFKPPEENLTYIISIANGKYIQVEKEQDTNFKIDSSQFISINSEEDNTGKIIYNIILNDKFSGKQKEIISSKFYPLNFSISPKKNYLGITMVDLDTITNKYFSSSVYVLSLSTYSLIDISTESKSYQPKWSNRLFK
jgi:hypothetical protein